MSEVWNHFYMAPNGLSVNCNHCGKFMKRSDSSTKSMWGHLKAFHSELVGEETFRLKRTRRMRGNNNNNNQETTKVNKKLIQKKTKIGNLKINTKCQNLTNSCNSSRINSENSSCSEENVEEVIQKNSENSYGDFGLSTSVTNRSVGPIKLELIKNEKENDKHEENEEKNDDLIKKEEEIKVEGTTFALSIQTLLKKNNEDNIVNQGENEAKMNEKVLEGIKCPKNVKEEKNEDKVFEVYFIIK
jgi:hypothetical protein